MELHSFGRCSKCLGKPWDTVVLMSTPRGEFPGVDPDAILLIRVPIYLSDSRRGLWVRLDGDAKDCGLKASFQHWVDKKSTISGTVVRNFAES